MWFSDPRQGAPVPANYQIRSVDRAIAILELFSDRFELSLGEIAEKSGLPKSTAFNILSVLEQHEFVTKHNGGSYRIGVGALRIGRQFLDGRGALTEVAKPLLEGLVERFPECRAQLAVLAGDKVVYLDAVESGPLHIYLGRDAPAYCTAPGKILLAELSENALSGYLSRAELAAFTPNTITDPRLLRENLQVARMQGYAVDDEENHRGFVCIAAALRTHDGSAVASISLRAVKALVSEADRAALTVAVCQAAKHISLAAPGASAPNGPTFHESPMLAGLVKAGKLPPVEQRLPKEPCVIKPIERIGKYGGTLRIAEIDGVGMESTRKLRLGALFHWNRTGTEPVIDQAKGFKWSADLKTLTLELREGHKWSDGAPFTADDIMFWWEDVQQNPELTPMPPSFWQPGGTPAKFRQISPTVLTITFAVPYPVAMDWLGRALRSCDPDFFLPKHYLSKWHIKFNPLANDLAKTEGFDQWTQALKHHARPERFSGIERPWLDAWIPEQMTSDRITYVRNPYFHQVDPEGNQLPYIDRVSAAIVPNAEAVALQASTGELDMEMYYIALKSMPMFMESQKQSDYRVLTCRSYRPSAAAYALNRTVKDPVLRKLFNTRDFRIALSLGIDRQAINEALFFGQAEPLQFTVNPLMSFYRLEWGKAYTEYDLERANTLLDGLGLTQKDDQGYRLRPDGQGRLRVLVENSAAAETPIQQIGEMVAASWAKLGIEAVARTVETHVLRQRVSANETQIAAQHSEGEGLFGRSTPFMYAFDIDAYQYWGYQWALWLRSDGKSGIEPPDEIKKQDALFAQYRQTVLGSPEFNQLGEQYYSYFAREIPVIGTVGLEPRPIVLSERTRNFPENDMWWGADTDFYGPFLPSQWFFDT
jgi:peptide/nickel transport system substrate-binding protein